MKLKTGNKFYKAALVSLTLLSLPFLASKTQAAGPYGYLTVVSVDSVNVNVRTNWVLPEENIPGLIGCGGYDQCSIGVFMKVYDSYNPDKLVVVDGFATLHGIKPGTPLKDAYNQLRNQRGDTGSFGIALNHALYNAVECIGFYIIAAIGGEHVFIEEWPTSSCIKPPPPNITCSFSMPGLVDFGSVPAGSEARIIREITGTARCTGPATITARLSEYVQLDNVPVDVSMNGMKLDTVNNIDVGTGTDVPLVTRFSVNGIFNNSGTHTGNAIFEMFYH